MVFPVVICGCDSWTIKKAERQRIDAFELWCWEKTLESSLDCKEIQPAHPKGNQSWLFIGRTDAEAEAPILWPSDVKNWLIGKDPDAGKAWRQEEKGTTEDEMVGWHHWLDGHEFEQAPRVVARWGSLAYCRPWGHKESDTTERLNWSSSWASLVVQWFKKKYITCPCRRHRFNPWVGKIPWRKQWQPLQYPCLGNPMNGGAWQAMSGGRKRVRHDLATLNPTT